MAGRKVPAATRQDVLTESGYKCGNPACRNVLTLQLHHIEWVKDGGGNAAGNLLALCGHCHDLHTAGHIPAQAIRHWKGMLVALNQAFGPRAIDLLLFLDYASDKPLWFSADGVLQFSGLIAAGLAEITEQTVGTPHQITQSSHRVALSPSGRLLIDAWRAGDEEKYYQVLQTRRTHPRAWKTKKIGDARRTQVTQDWI